MPETTLGEPLPAHRPHVGAVPVHPRTEALEAELVATGELPPLP